MAAGDTTKITEKDGVYYISGVVNEHASFDALLKVPPPLKMNFKGVTRINSIGIRNLLKFLTSWGEKDFEYHQCTSEMIDQINMIPGLLGISRHGVVKSLFVPYECDECEHEEEVEHEATDFIGITQGQPIPTRPCPKCKAGKLEVLSDAFFMFLKP